MYFKPRSKVNEIVDLFFAKFNDKSVKIMKVYISSTPEFSEKKLSEVVSTLQDIKGAIEFISSTPITLNQQKLFINKSNEQITNLTFNELFRLCDGYRTIHEEFISNDDFVVIISNYPHSKNWFSGFRGKNIFVDGENWDLFSSKDSKYAISFQIAENIFQSLIDLKIEDDKLDTLIHLKSIGCVNDMCTDKIEISQKFFAGHICDECYNVGAEKIEDNLVLSHLEYIFDKLRNEFVKRGDRPERFLSEPVIDEENKIKIGSLEFQTNPQQKSIYMFFIENTDGVNKDHIHERAMEFYAIYKRVKSRAKLINIANIFGYKVTPSNELGMRIDDNRQFLSQLSKIKDKLDSLLGDELSKYYYVEMSSNENFIINLYKKNNQ